MRLILLHPGVAAIDCQECSRKLMDFTTGRPVLDKLGNGQMVEITHDKPPCLRPNFTCPKGTIDTASKSELTERNWACWNAYRREKAVGFQHCELDDLAKENFAIIADIERVAEQRRLADMIYPAIEARNGS